MLLLGFLISHYPYFLFISYLLIYLLTMQWDGLKALLIRPQLKDIGGTPRNFNKKILSIIGPIDLRLLDHSGTLELY